MSLGALTGASFLWMLFVLFLNVIFLTVIVVHIVKHYDFYKKVTVFLGIISLLYIIAFVGSSGIL